MLYLVVALFLRFCHSLHKLTLMYVLQSSLYSSLLSTRFSCVSDAYSLLLSVRVLIRMTRMQETHSELQIIHARLQR